MGNFENPWGKGSKHYERWMGVNPWAGAIQGSTDMGISSEYLYRGNLALIIRSEQTKRTKEGFEIEGNSQWDAIEINDIVEGMQQARFYKASLERQAIKNLIVFSHGSLLGINVFPNKVWGITIDDLKRNSDRSLQQDIEYTESHPTEINNRANAHFVAKKNGIEALASIVEILEPGGNLCFAGCGVGAYFESETFIKVCHDVCWELSMERIRNQPRKKHWE